MSLNFYICYDFFPNAFIPLSCLINHNSFLKIYLRCFFWEFFLDIGFPKLIITIMINNSYPVSPYFSCKDDSREGQGLGWKEGFISCLKAPSFKLKDEQSYILK